MFLPILNGLSRKPQDSATFAPFSASRGIPIGIFLLHRTAVRPFTEKQIELVETFADQAVTAIENTRLFEAEQQRTRELTELLDKQTATSEVLRVISSSSGELEPVFQAMLENATRICEAKFAHLFLYEDSSFRVVALQNAPQAYAERWRDQPVLRIADNPRNPLSRLAATKDLSTFPTSWRSPAICWGLVTGTRGGHRAPSGESPHHRRHHLENGYRLTTRQGVSAGALDGVGDGDELC